jgi:hypothetical protein
MAKPGTTPPETSDEIDLGQLFKLIGNGFRNLFRWILSVYLYFKRNIIWFAGLVVLGALTGYLVNQLVEGKQKLDVIVTPNLETKNYLYDVIAEVQANIKAEDTLILAGMGMEVDKMKGFEIEITPLKSENRQDSETQNQMLELLKDFGNSEAISDILRAELQDRTSKDQRITFYFKDPGSGEKYARKIVEYINSNPYYNELVQVNTLNAENRIQRNDTLIRQIDVLIDNYTQKMLKEQSGAEGRLVLENQEPLDVPSLFELKNQLIRDTEAKKLELERTKDAITIVNFGKPHKVIKPLYQKNIVFFPLLFVGFFLLISLIRYLNMKAAELL